MGMTPLYVFIDGPLGEFGLTTPMTLGSVGLKNLFLPEKTRVSFNFKLQVSPSHSGFFVLRDQQARGHHVGNNGLSSSGPMGAEENVPGTKVIHRSVSW